MSEPERRLTPTERLHEVTMAALLRRTSEPEQSVTISRNAKGVYQFEVTVRGPDVIEAYNLAETTTRSLVAMYPYPETNGGES